MQAVSTIESLLVKGLNELSLSCTAGQVRQFMAYLSEIKKWNKAYNLTAIKADEDIIVKHFLDSLLYLKALPAGEISVMDVGSGAGFPGIPIKIVRPEITMYLVEPSWKKANFLRHVAGLLCLDNITVVEKKVENLESMDVDVAVTRALFDIKDFCAKVSPVLRRRGMAVLSKGPKIGEELKAFEKQGLSYKILEADLPFTDIKRFLVIVSQDAGNAPAGSEPPADSAASKKMPCICVNVECRMRKAGCRGFQWCPGFKAKA